MAITRRRVADKLSGYLQGREQLADLVSWAETAMCEGEFDRADRVTIRDVVSRLGLADVAVFGLTKEWIATATGLCRPIPEPKCRMLFA